MSVSASVTFCSACGDDCVITITEPPMASISMSPPFCSCRMPRGSTALTTRVNANPARERPEEPLGADVGEEGDEPDDGDASRSTVAGKKAHFITAMCRSMSWIT